MAKKAIPVKQEEKEKKADPLPTGSKPDRRRLTRYLRELSVVVIGIAITFIGSNWISNRKDQKELANDLEAVKTELGENLRVVREKGYFYERTARVAHYLSSHYPDRLDLDSLNLLFGNGPGNVMGHAFTFTYKTSAFEMLKNSGTLRLIRNKMLSRSILDSYAFLETIKYDSDSYMAIKRTEIMGAMMDLEEGEDFFNSRNKRVIRFLANHVDNEVVFRECAEQIEKTLTLFQK